MGLWSKENLYLASACFSLFLVGWDDGTLGPLLPRMQDSYHVGYTVVSTIFITKCSGCICAALVNMWLSDKYGFGVAVTGGAVLQAIGFVIQSPRPPFPLMVISYFISGFGAALQDAQDNGFISVFPTGQHAKMMIGHGFYGLGAFAAPLISTQFAQQKHWTFHYLVSLGLALMNIVSLLAVFRMRREADIINGMDSDAGEGHAVALHDPSASQGLQKYGELMRLRIVHVAALFIFAYVGVEVTLGAWSVTYIIQQRGGGASSGYVSSGFFGGITLGRFLLIWVNKAVGETRVIFLYSAICVALQVTVWQVPSLWENAIATSFVGFFLGPIYPTVVLTLSKMVPPRFMSGAIGWITCCGSTGAAVFPFILGAMAQKVGVWALQPLAVALLGLLVVVWGVAIIWGPSTNSLDADVASSDLNKEHPPQPQRLDSFESEKLA